MWFCCQTQCRKSAEKIRTNPRLLCVKEALAGFACLLCRIGVISHCLSTAPMYRRLWSSVHSGRYIQFCLSRLNKQKKPRKSRLFWRKGWDSNPRSVISRTHDFQSCALDQLSHLCRCVVSIFYSFQTALILYHIGVLMSRPFLNFFFFSGKHSFGEGGRDLRFYLKSAIYTSRAIYPYGMWGETGVVIFWVITNSVGSNCSLHLIHHRTSAKFSGPPSPEASMPRWRRLHSLGDWREYGFHQWSLAGFGLCRK